MLAIIGFLGWLTSRPVEPVSSMCDETGYEATYLRSDFHRDARTAAFTVVLEDELYGRNWYVVERFLRSDPEAIVEIRVESLHAAPITSCEVTDIELRG